MDCDQFAERLADYLEGDAPDAVRDAIDAHAAACAGCGQLLADLSTLRHDAAALPLLTPSRDLWAGIAERIDTQVLPLAAPRSVRASWLRHSWARPAIAAAALVVVTAGITHMLTRASLTPAGSVAGAPSQQVAAAAPSTAPDAVVAPEASAPTAEFQSTATERTSRATTASGAPRPVARLASASPLMKEAEPVYDREITKLRAIVKTRRAQLDPSTVAVLEQSIAVIDSAIAQSRAALAKDPASGFLATQLNRSLEKKVELLRTAALLPART
jgi:hypothetical protein